MIRLRRPPVLQYHEELFVPNASLSAINEGWDAFCSQHSSAVDGDIVHVLGVHRNGCGGATIQVAKSSYRFHAVRDLGIKPLGVKGICMNNNDAYLCGLRSGEVGVYPNQWEFAPSGMVEPFETPEKAMQRELEEETGLRLKSPPIAIALLFDEIASSWEIVYRLDVKGTLRRGEEEYNTLGWFDLKSFPTPMSPPAMQLKSLL